MSIAAVIPAAGYSSRMGFYKPLLPTWSSLIIERAIMTFYEAGIKDIFVVVGFKADLLKPITNRLGVSAVTNENYSRGMYSSIQVGVRSLSDETEAFFLLPADYAFVSAKTICKLKEAFFQSGKDVIYPMYNGIVGHPPLISNTLKNLIIANEPHGGLKDLLKKKENTFEHVSVDDSGILYDLDTEDDYLKAICAKLPLYPSFQKCKKILNQYNVKDNILSHVYQVARIAGIISEYLNSKGFRIHLGLVMASSLLHDIAKGEENHQIIGQQIVSALHYPKVADIIACHVDLPEYHVGEISEYSIVYLADKMVQGDKLVSLETQFNQKLVKYKENSFLQKIVIKRMENAIKIRENIEDILQLKLEEILE